MFKAASLMFGFVLVAAACTGCPGSPAAPGGTGSTGSQQQDLPQIPSHEARPPSAPSGVRANMLVSTQWLADNVANPDLAILQIGRPIGPDDAPGDDRASYDTAHVPGAQFVAWNEIAVTRASLPNELPALADLVKLARRLGITHNSRIVLYDDQTGLPSARCYVALDYLGLGEHACLLDGLWKKWQAEHRAVSFGAAPAAAAASQPSNFVPRPSPEVILPLSAMRELVWEKTALRNPPIALIDARPADEYTGQTPGAGITRPGHIPGAVNVFWTRDMVSDEMPVLKPVAELRAIYEKAGALPGSGSSLSTLVIAYCRTGGQASHVYFTAKYLGYDVRLYDGSFWEWSKAKDTAVEGPAAATQSETEGDIRRNISMEPIGGNPIVPPTPEQQAQIRALIDQLEAEETLPATQPESAIPNRPVGVPATQGTQPGGTIPRGK